ncbi:MAG TPA: glutaredoxin family protein [Candidatus Nitrosocosmicus sp.]|nr:glutaredoxin family protein [Candidatus Nitrosocosmicus sp.]
MQITVYTIKDCPFCKAEKDFLTSHNIPFTEKNVEENREALAEMLEVSDKFAGVPFTMIVKDDGTKVPLKGYTQSEFEQALGIQTATAAPSTTPVVNQAAPAESVAAPIQQEPSEPNMAVANAGITLPMDSTPAEPAPVMPPPPVMPEPPMVEPTVPATTPEPTNNELQGVLNNLVSMSGATETTNPDEPSSTVDHPVEAPPMPGMPQPPVPQPPTPVEPSPTNDQGTPNPGVPNIPDLPKP